MLTFESGEFTPSRHAHAATDGRPCGRVDGPLKGGDDAAMVGVAQTLDGPAHVFAGPALRCRRMAQAIFPKAEPALNAQRWEQDFGDGYGMTPCDRPDRGPMSRDDRARRRALRGERFADMAYGVAPMPEVAARTDARVAVVAHVGTEHAGLALAPNSAPAALAFRVAPLSLTRLRRLRDAWLIISVNVIL